MENMEAAWRKEDRHSRTGELEIGCQRNGKGRKERKEGRSGIIGNEIVEPGVENDSWPPVDCNEKSKLTSLINAAQ